MTFVQIMKRDDWTFLPLTHRLIVVIIEFLFHYNPNWLREHNSSRRSNHIRPRSLLANRVSPKLENNCHKSDTPSRLMVCFLESSQKNRASSLMGSVQWYCFLSLALSWMRENRAKKQTKSFIFQIFQKQLLVHK